jgi:hypothetical protein
MDEQVIRLAGDLALTAVVRGQYIGPLANPRDGGRTMTVILERVGFRGETRVTPARDGTFRFGPLAPGSYVLGARIHAVPEVLVEFTLRAGETKDLGPLQLPLPGRIVGQVLDATGRPRTDVRIEVRRLGGDASRADVSDRLCRLDPQRQAWVVTSLPPGDYAFTARTLGAVGQVERVRVLAGETAQVTIRARRGVEQRFAARLRANPEQARHPRASQQGRVGFCIRDARGNTVLDRRFEATWTDRDQRVVEFTFRFAPGRYTARLEDHWGNAYPGNHRIVEFVIEAARPAAPIVVEFRK